MRNGGMLAAGLIALAIGGMPATAQNASAPATGPTAAKDAEITAALPVIPEATFNVRDFGAAGDYKAFDTDAFKKAVAAAEAAAAGGGHVIVPAGTYKMLPFSLGSHIDLHLESGATIKAPDHFAEYGIPDPADPANAAVYGGRGGRGGGRGVAPLISCPANCTDISITGSGTIDGSGDEFWQWSDKAARKYPAGRPVVARPVLVSLTGVQRLLVQGVTLTHSPMFHLVPRGQDITIDAIRVIAPADAPNTDAMDPGGQRIVIKNCYLDTGDDNVAIQSGSHDVLIEHLECLHGHGISIGSPTRNGLSHIIVRDCTFDGTDNGLRIKSYRGNGGDVHDISYSHITMANVRRPIDINLLYNGNAATGGDVGPRQAQPGQTQAIPQVHDVHFADITITHAPVAGRILGLPELPAHDLTFKNVTIQAQRGLQVQDAKDVTFEKCAITTPDEKPLILDNAAVDWNGEKMGSNSVAK